MHPILRNSLAVFAGLIVGSVVNTVIVVVGPMVIPPPEGVDLTDPEKFSESLKLLQPVHFIAPWLAHALGTLAGAFVAAKLAASSGMKLALGIGAFFLTGGIMMVAMHGGPIWFAIVDLAGAYLPMAYLGGKLAGAEPVSID